MSYEGNRVKEQLRVLRPEIQNFIVRYNANPPVGRQTVFLFPGGMASRLVRAKKVYQPGPDQVFDYVDIWLTPESFLGRAADLKMKRVNKGDHRDKDDKIIVSDGLVNFLGATPYLGFTAWCAAKNLDYFVFPWDWRRGVDDVGDFFIDDFLPDFQNLVKAGCNNADPLARFSLIGHSCGGMVVNWALRSNAAIMAGLDKAITVATPFYGYSSQLHRWFDGEEYLNGPLNSFKKGIIKAICSFPGCYAWLFLPHNDRYVPNAAAFAADPVAPLMAYPSVDSDTGAVADPYDPQSNGALRRYPTTRESAFDSDELKDGKDLVKFLSGPLTAAKAGKFYNIRADTGANNTRHATTWRWVPPIEPCPIANASVGMGDGVQPGWTARHIDLEGLAPGHVVTVVSPLAEHATLMSVPETIKAISKILGVPWP
jgi:hypothetical protein